MRAIKLGQVVSRDQPRRKTVHDLVVSSLLMQRKIQELAQMRLCPKIQFQFDFKKVVQNKIERRSKFSSLQFGKVTFLRGGLFYFTCWGCKRNLRLIAWQRAVGDAGLSYMFCS